MYLASPIATKTDPTKPVEPAKPTESTEPKIPDPTEPTEPTESWSSRSPEMPFSAVPSSTVVAQHDDAANEFTDEFFAQTKSTEKKASAASGTSRAPHAYFYCYHVECTNRSSSPAAIRRLNVSIVPTSPPISRRYACLSAGTTSSMPSFPPLPSSRGDRLHRFSTLVVSETHSTAVPIQKLVLAEELTVLVREEYPGTIVQHRFPGHRENSYEVDVGLFALTSELG
ncbi:hypothetical protein BDQ17DRAFT_1425553 [Cyathus striatus]|nr:hypothetical protein BDQ17DRAFT_1425553 [Cyathus striatus]